MESLTRLRPAQDVERCHCRQATLSFGSGRDECGQRCDQKRPYRRQGQVLLGGNARGSSGKDKWNQVLQTTSRRQVIPGPEVKLKEEEQKQENPVKIEKVLKLLSFINFKSNLKIWKTLQFRKFLKLWKVWYYGNSRNSAGMRGPQVWGVPGYERSPDMRGPQLWGVPRYERCPSMLRGINVPRNITSEAFRRPCRKRLVK